MAREGQPSPANLDYSGRHELDAPPINRVNLKRPSRRRQELYGRHSRPPPEKAVAINACAQAMLAALFDVRREVAEVLEFLREEDDGEAEEG